MSDPARPLGSVGFRRPREDDHSRVVEVVDDWFNGPRVQQLLPRLWFRHFAGTSWLVEEDGRLAAFLVGFLSPDRPDEAVVHLAAVSPNLRRRGVGRALYERFFEDARTRGARRVSAVAWPEARPAVAFHEALGFRIDAGPGTRPIHGVPAHPDYDGNHADRVVLTRDL